MGQLRRLADRTADFRRHRTLRRCRCIREPIDGCVAAGRRADGHAAKSDRAFNGRLSARGHYRSRAIGGLSYGVSAALPYAIMAGFWATAAILNGGIKIERPVSARESPTPGALFAGLHFVRNNPAILGTISLDLFAVLLGGASALLPIYARDILQTGPWGLGMLRGAQAVGALMMTGFLSRHAIIDRVGMRMFQAVIVFGVATVVFGLSHMLWLSVLALGVMGAADTISVVIRVSLVQLATPDEMRGRVGAVNFLFINASNQLGEFESGMMAALLGAVPAVVFGGVGTIAVALLWMKLFPALRDLNRLE